MKKASILIISYIVCFVFTSGLYAQGEYLERGSSAYGIGVSAAFHPNIFGLSGAAAVSVLGTFDIGMAYALISSNRAPSSSVISPFASLHLLKQSESHALAFSLNVQYQIHRYPSGDITVTMGSWAAGGTVFRSVKVAEHYSLQPAVNLSFISPEKPLYGTDTGLVTSTEISLALISQWEDKKIGTVKPSVSFSNGETAYSISFELVNIFLKK
ncbi:MAG: hypothetical protein ACM3Q2_18440 [Syntrophothermus sp.]